MATGADPGLGDGEFEFVCVQYGSILDVTAWAEALQALQGKITTVINDWANDYPGCLVLKMTPPKMTVAYAAGGTRGEITIGGVVT